MRVAAKRQVIKKPYSYVSVPTLARAAIDRTEIRGIRGPIGSGKSAFCVIEIIRKAREQKPGRDGIRRTKWVVIRNTYKQLKDTTIATFLQWLPPKFYGRFNMQNLDYHITGILGCDIEVKFRALDRPDQVDNLLSLEVTGAWVNEARSVPWAIIEALDGRLGRYPAMEDGGPTWEGAIFDTNPPDEESWWHKKFEEERPDGWKGYTQPPAIRVRRNDMGRYDFLGIHPRAENTPNLRANYYPRTFRGKDPEWVDVFLLNKYGFSMDGKPVYDEFSDHLHYRESLLGPIPGIPIWRGWDFGVIPTCVFAQVAPSGQLLIFDELIPATLGLKRFSKNVANYCQQEYAGFQFYDIGDPSGQSMMPTDGQTCFQILHEAGFNIVPGIQGLRARLESVRWGLTNLVGAGEPALVVGPKAKVTRKGFLGGYCFRRVHVTGDRFEDKPDKNQYSHPMDCVQYIATRVFGEPLLGMAAGLYLPEHEDEDVQVIDISRDEDENGFYW